VDQKHMTVKYSLKEYWMRKN